MDIRYFGGIVSAIFEVMTASEADDKYKLPKGTVKRDCNLKKKFQDYEARKSKGVWIISIAALDREYKNRGGELK